MASIALGKTGLSKGQVIAATTLGTALEYYDFTVYNFFAILPCGVDHAGMPFGLQIVGPFRGDMKALAVSQALETAFSAYPHLRRPRPDLARLTRANPALTSIVTAPPVYNPAGSDAAGLSAV